MGRVFASSSSVLGLSLLVAVAFVFFTWPLVANPMDLLGHPFGEATNHHWMFWRAGEEGLVANFPEGLALPLMDPVHLPVYRLFDGISPVLGYNVVFVFNWLLAFGGAWFLSRQLGVGRAAALSAGMACACSPFMSGLASFGITESWGVGWLGFHLGFLLRFSSSLKPVDGFGAALSLWAYLLTGWYSAFFAVVLELLVFVHFYRERLLAWRLFVPSLLAGLAVLPRFLEFWSGRDFWAMRWGGVLEPLAHRWEEWRVTPRGGADLVNLVLPSTGSEPVSKTVYLGLFLLFLAFWGRKKSRLVLLWASCFVVLSLGGHLMVAGHQQFMGVAISLPAAWLTWAVPSLEGLSHWYRALGPATLLLSVAAAFGVQRLVDRAGFWLWLAPLLMLLDSVFLGQTPWPRTVYSAASPDVYSALPPQGVLIEIPFHNRRGRSGRPRVSNLWQPFHGLAVAENHEGDDAALRANKVFSVMQSFCEDGGGLLLDPGVAKMWMQKASRDGFTHLVLRGVGEVRELDEWQCGARGQDAKGRPKAMAVSQELRRHVELWLGPPLAESEGDALFVLPATK